MKDARRDIQCTLYMYCRIYIEIEHLPAVVVQVYSDGQGVMTDVRRDIQCTCTVECT